MTMGCRCGTAVILLLILLYHTVATWYLLHPAPSPLPPHVQVERRAIPSLDMWAVAQAQLVNQSLKKEWSSRVDSIPSNAMFYFVHLPKCGGTGVANLVWYGAAKAEMHQTWQADSDGHLRGIISEVARTKKRVVYGHFSYGLHLIINKHLFAGGSPDSFYGTMLREPIERVLSHYYYHREKKNDPGHELAMRLDLLEWVRESPAGSNRMTQYLAGFENHNATRQMLELAKSHLMQMSFVGLTEEYDKSIKLLAHQLGRKPLRISTHFNAVRNHPRAMDLPFHVLQEIYEANKLDMELYKLAQQIFRARWSSFNA